MGEAGAEAYARYTHSAAPFVAAVGGKLPWQGRRTHLIVGEEVGRTVGDRLGRYRRSEP